MRTARQIWEAFVAEGHRGLSGLQSFLGDWSLATTLGQRISTVGQGVFGACGVLAGTGAVLKRKWGEVAALAFAVSAGITAGLASMAWGGSGLHPTKCWSCC